MIPYVRQTPSTSKLSVITRLSVVCPSSARSWVKRGTSHRLAKEKVDPMMVMRSFVPRIRSAHSAMSTKPRVATLFNPSPSLVNWSLLLWRIKRGVPRLCPNFCIWRVTAGCAIASSWLAVEQFNHRAANSKTIRALAGGKPDFKLFDIKE